MPPFKVESEFVPMGDQPSAIEALAKGVEGGARLQTLLGATGTGKSVTYETDIFVVEEGAEQRTARVMPIGELIDGLMMEHDGSVRVEHDNEILDAALATRRYFVQSFDPDSGAVGLYPVSAFTRHATPDRMYHVETACGRSATMTGDHNLWVLRDGRLRLIETADARPSDYLPLPEALPEIGERRTLDTLSYLATGNFFVHAPMALRQHLDDGPATFNAVISRHALSAVAKRHAIRHEINGAGIAVGIFQELLGETEQLGGHYAPAEARVGRRRRRGSLGAELSMTLTFLQFLGAYVAEGCARHDVTIVTTHAPTLHSVVRAFAAQHNLTCAEYVPGNLRLFSSALATVLKRLCGAEARGKRLPDFWPELSDESLALLLRAYFDGDGTVDRALAVSATTASERLASDLCYALLRFGIWGRISKKWKRATNADHNGDWYYQVTISGQSDLGRFAEWIGFTIESKQSALLAHLGREENSNVDVVPIDGRDLRALRKGLGLLAREVAERAGLSRSGLQLIETNERRPQRATLVRVLDTLRPFAEERRVDSGWWERFETLRRLCALRWTPIVEVTPVEPDHPYVYDVTVPGPETFLAGRGGMFVHNTYVVAKVVEHVQKPTLVLAHNKTLAAQLYAEFKEFFPNNAVEYFVSYYDYYQPEAYVPKSDLFIEKDSSINDEINRLRLAATQALFTRQDVIIVASVSAIYGLGSPEDYGRVAVELKRGETRKRDRLLRHLIDIHYERNDFDLKRGTFRVRGDTLEIMPAYEEAAYRVEFWDDEVERITEVDALTGEIVREHVSLDIYPAKHFITPDDKLNEAILDIEMELEERLRELRANDKLLEAQRLEQRTRYDLEMLREIGYCSGVENYSRPLSRRPPGSTPWTLLDYFPDDYLMVIDESHMTLPQVRGMFNGDRARKEVLVEYGFRLPSALDNRPLRWEEFEQTIPQTIFVSATPGPYEREHSEQIVRQVIRPTGILDPVITIRPSKGQVDDLVSEINARIGRGERALVTTLTKRMAEDLADYLADLGIKVHYLHSEIQTLERVEILRELRLGVYDVVVGINLLREGLDLPEVSLVAILDADKEGFLRSDAALIQTMGRAARHPDGVVVMYADVITASMQRAIDEVEARRAIQQAYNEEHGIEPHAIAKAVRDLTDRVKVAEAPEAYDATALAALPADELTRMIEDLERQMRAAAQELAFERAAQLRDQINDLRIVIDASDTRPEWEKVRDQQRKEAAAERALAKQARKRGIRYDA